MITGETRLYFVLTRLKVSCYNATIIMITDEPNPKPELSLSLWSLAELFSV